MISSMISLSSRKNIDVKMLKVIKTKEDFRNSRFIDELVLDDSRIHYSMSKSLENVYVMIIDIRELK